MEVLLKSLLYCTCLKCHPANVEAEEKLNKENEQFDDDCVGGRTCQHKRGKYAIPTPSHPATPHSPTNAFDDEDEEESNKIKDPKHPQDGNSYPATRFLTRLAAYTTLFTAKCDSLGEQASGYADSGIGGDGLGGVDSSTFVQLLSFPQLTRWQFLQWLVPHLRNTITDKATQTFPNQDVQRHFAMTQPLLPNNTCLTMFGKSCTVHAVQTQLGDRNQVKKTLIDGKKKGLDTTTTDTPTSTTTTIAAIPLANSGKNIPNSDDPFEQTLDKIPTEYFVTPDDIQAFRRKLQQLQP